jgi:hypothetical protein
MSSTDYVFQLEELRSLGFISDEEFARRTHSAGNELSVSDFQTVLACTCETSCGAPHMCLRCGEEQVACQVSKHAQRCAGNWLAATPCPNAWQGCAASVNRVTYSTHIEYECDYAHVLCKCIGDEGVCLAEVRRGELAAHMAQKHAKQTTSFCRKEALPTMQQWFHIRSDDAVVVAAEN